MVQLTKIYTRGGDKGETSLGDGSRVAKHHLRVEAYGTVDEANAVIGLARVEILRTPDTDDMLDPALNRIQNDLFDLGADLCTPEDGRRAEGALRIIDTQVYWLESEIDRINGALDPLSQPFHGLDAFIGRAVDRGIVGQWLTVAPGDFPGHAHPDSPS